MIYKLYIGSNNETKKLEKQKAMTTASKYFPGFSCYQITGSWQGTQEKTLILEIETSKPSMIKLLAQELKISLHQQAIGVIKTQEKMAFV